MTNCHLTEHQKALILALKPYIENKELDDYWIVSFLQQGIIIYNLDQELEEEGLNKITLGDLDQFVKCGLLRAARYDENGSISNYAVNLKHILKVIEQNFEF